MCSDVRKDKDAATLERLVPWALAGRTAWSHRMPQSAPKKLRQHHPELWERLREMDKRALAQFGPGPLGQFKKDWSVERLEQRFAAEAQQLSISSLQKERER